MLLLYNVIYKYIIFIPNIDSMCIIHTYTLTLRQGPMVGKLHDYRTFDKYTN
jgi:hypothetical protein